MDEDKLEGFLIQEEERLCRFIAEVKNADKKDNEKFHCLLSEGMGLLRLSDREMARQFGASRPTINRWKKGINAPHPAMRVPVYRFFQKRAKAILKQLKRKC